MRLVDQTLSMDGSNYFGPITCQLTPLSETTYLSTEDEDMEVQFEEEMANGFHRMTILTPFDSISTMKVLTDKSDDSDFGPSPTWS